jgi:hypothetical protein
VLVEGQAFPQAQGKSLLYRLRPMTTLFHLWSRSVIADAFGDQGDDSVIRIIANMRIHWIG